MGVNRQRRTETDESGTRPTMRTGTIYVDARNLHTKEGGEGVVWPIRDKELRSTLERVPMLKRWPDGAPGFGIE